MKVPNSFFVDDVVAGDFGYALFGVRCDRADAFRTTILNPTSTKKIQCVARFVLNNCSFDCRFVADHDEDAAESTGHHDHGFSRKTLFGETTFFGLTNLVDATTLVVGETLLGWKTYEISCRPWSCDLLDTYRRARASIDALSW
jgi:hypothetical protein